MRKLSLLIAFALMVTIGGVYAAWNYAQGATASVEITREINMAQVNTNSNKGSISASPTDVAFIVDDASTLPDGAGAQKYTAKLVGTGSFAITFTPSIGADATVATSGIVMQATISIKTTTQDGAKYNDGGVQKTPITVKSNNKIQLNGGAATTSATLTVAQILECVELCDVVLDTKAKNEAFHNALIDYTIVITISEVTA